MAPALAPGTPPTSPRPTGPVKAKASFKLAQARARAKRLQRFEDESNLKLATNELKSLSVGEGTRNLSVFASHHEIGEVSLGLAQYFGAIYSLASLMLVLFLLIGSYHLHDFRTNVGLGNQYLVVTKLLVGDGVSPCATESWCKKSDENFAAERISIITNSLGARCAYNRTSSFYNCPTVCTHYTTEWEVYATSDGVVSSATPNELCKRHLPCGMSTLSEGEKSLCCVETLNDGTYWYDAEYWNKSDTGGGWGAGGSLDWIENRKGKETPEAVYGVQVLTTLLILVWYGLGAFPNHGTLFTAPEWLFTVHYWTLWFHKRQLVVAEEVNAENVTTGDYAVAVRGLGEHEWRREDLATHMAHYGEIVTVCYTKSIGRLLAAETKLHVATTKLDEIKAYRGKVAALSPLPARRKKHTMTHAYHAVAVALFNLSTTGGFGTEKHLATLEVRVKKFQEKCDLETKQKIKNVGDAFVVFNFECHKTRLFEDYRRGWYERTLQWAFPKLKIGAPRFKGKILTMEPPPEPSDVRWGNYGIWRWKRVTKDCATALGMLAAVLVGVVLQGVFTTIKNDLRIDTYDRQLYARATGTTPTLDPEDAALVQTYTIFSSLVIVAVNVFLTTTAELLSTWQKFSTQSEFEASLMLKLCVVHVINSIAVPASFSRCPNANAAEIDTLISGGEGVSAISQNGKCLWYAPGGLVESAFYLQLFNAVLPNVIAYVDVVGRLKRKYLAKYARTQRAMDAACDPPQFILAAKYAHIMKTIAMALIYGPILPVSYVLAVFALCVTYVTDKILALKRCQKPVRQQNQATERVVVFMNVMTLVQVFFAQVYFYDLRYPQYLIACVMIWVVYMLLPLNKWLGITRDSTTEDGGTAGVSFWTHMGKAAGGKGFRPKKKQHGVTHRDEDDFAAQEKTKRFHSKLLNVPESELNADRLDIYVPPMPVGAGDKTRAMIMDGYKLPHTVTPGIPSLLRGQKKSTGGRENVAPPRSNQRDDQSQVTSPTSVASKVKRFLGLGNGLNKVTPGSTPRSSVSSPSSPKPNGNTELRDTTNRARAPTAQSPKLPKPKVQSPKLQSPKVQSPKTSGNPPARKK